MSIFNNNKLDPFGTNSLFADINNTNQQINSMNLPSFAKEEEEKKRKKAEQMMKLQNLADTFNMVNAQKSGNAQGVALYSNRMKQRQLEQQAAKAKAEQKAQQELLKQQQDAFIKANPDYAKMIQMNELFGFTPPAEKNRESYVAKDGYRYFVDKNERVFPGVTVTEKQSQEDIYKENAARIKNIILTEGTSGLTDNELAFYDDYIKRTGGNPFNQALANIVGNDNPGTQRNKIYKVINNAYGNTSAESIIKQAMELNGVSREEAIRNLKANNIIAE